jgi:ABC-type sugar transport system ATPase subunit
MVAIKAADLAMSFGGVLVLRGMTRDIAVGEIHGLVGENGAGKST